MSDFIDKLPLLPVSADLQNFDYFVEKEEFKKELAEKDDEFCCGLIKQYARRIQIMEKELLAMEEIEGMKL
uniref:Uncharacterized protein n=1 Tax=Panagrolaimus sp. ES5 TaxID=591445 RepID=A0AC34F7I1_9BILA